MLRFAKYHSRSSCGRFCTCGLQHARHGVLAVLLWNSTSGDRSKIGKAELPQIHGFEKIMPFGRLFLAIPMGVFGTEHLTNAADIANIVPRWMPAHTFWVYLVGIALIAAALSITVKIPSRLAATLLRIMLCLFVALIHIPTSLTTHAIGLFGPWAYETLLSAEALLLSPDRRWAVAANALAASRGS
jgi:uncharacterized membrane protein